MSSGAYMRLIRKLQQRKCSATRFFTSNVRIATRAERLASHR
jgi:hypothetical protein